MAETDRSFWDERVTAFKLKAKQFQAALDWLLNNRENVANIARDNSALSTEYGNLLNRGQKIKSVLRSVTAKIDTAVQWFKSTFSGYDASAYMEESQQMGVLPAVAFVAITAIAGAIALMGKYITDVYLFQKKLEEIKRLESKGLTPSQAANIVQKTSPQGLVVSMGGSFKILAIGGTLYVLYNIAKRKGVI